jgi:hypothetical protein
MKGTPLKNRLYRWMGAHIGKNVETVQMVWLDHYRPELIRIGDNTLIGAFSRITVHGYEGAGCFRCGLAEIGKDCRIGGDRRWSHRDGGRGPDEKCPQANPGSVTLLLRTPLLRGDDR